MLSPRDSFPGGSDYRMARERMVDQGMIDIVVSLKLEPDLSTVLSKLNITKKFTSQQDINQFMQDYMTLL